MDKPALTGTLTSARFTDLIRRNVKGSEKVIAHQDHDCPSDPAGQTCEFESSDGSISFQWREACDWTNFRIFKDG